MESRKKATASARGEEPFDLAITNVRLVNVLTRELLLVDIGISGERIALVNPAGHSSIQAGQILDGQGLWAAPGFIDGHVHNESTMATPACWAEVILPKGTTCVITDPHEIANVLGLQGVRYMLDASEGLPLRYYITAPSCVPSVPGLESNGATFTEKEMKEMLAWERVVAVGEAMDYVGLIGQTGNITPIVEAGQAANVPIEGHAPGVSGQNLQAYLAAAGPRCSDHECLDAENMIEKVQNGVMVYARVSSFLDGADELARAINSVPDSRSFGMCTDDIHPNYLLEKGHIDHGMRTLIAAGVDPLVVYQMASLNVAQHYGLWGLGAIAPGWLADIVLLDDLEKVSVRHVITAGKVRVRDGKLSEPISQPIPPLEVNSMRLPEELSQADLTPRGSHDGRVRFHAMNLSHNANTLLEEVEIKVSGGYVEFPLPEGVSLAAVIGRHGQNRKPSFSFITGFPIQSGAVASTVSHDSHNLVVIGKNPADMLVAIHHLKDCGGGLVATKDGAVLASLPLPIAGLLSPLQLTAIVDQEMQLHKAFSKLGLSGAATATLLFMTLPVIPQVRLTDHGLVDVNAQKIIDLEIS